MYSTSESNEGAGERGERAQATSEIAEEIANALCEALKNRGAEDVVVDVRPAEQVGSVEDYDAMVAN